MYCVEFYCFTYLEKMFLKTAKAVETKNTADNSGEVRYSKNSADIVDLSLDKALIERINNSNKSAITVMRDYIFEKLGGRDIELSDGVIAVINKSDAKHIGQSSKSTSEKAQISEIEKIIKLAKFYKEIDVIHNKFSKFRYYELPVKYDDKLSFVTLNVGKGKNDGKYHIYDLTEPKERNTPNRINGFARPVGNALRKGVSNYSIPTTAENVKLKSVGQNDIKRSQLEIIKETNPMWDNYHTGIRTVDDIRTWEEVLELNDEREGQFVWGDFSREDAEQALKDNTITVYSSYPIKNGVFVSTSYIQAHEYAGGQNGKVYSKTIPLTNVAWINGDEGQYAEVDNIRYSLPTRAEAEDLLDRLQTAETDKTTAENSGGVEYSIYSGSKGAENIHDTTQDLLPQSEREWSAFNRQFANKTNGLKNGKKSNIMILTKDYAYFVSANGYMRGRIVEKMQIDGNEERINNMTKEFKDGTFIFGEGTDLLAQSIRSDRGRGYRHHASLKETLAAEGYADVDGNTHIGDSGRNNSRSGKTSSDVSYSITPIDRAYASPVTYDNVDNVIPLSQRFDETQADIRYSIPSNSIDTYTETQYNNFGWVRANDVLTAAEYSTLLSRYADYKHNKDNYPTTRFGEAVIHSFDFPDIIMYVKGTIRIPQITKVVRIIDENPYVINIIQEELLKLEAAQTISSFSFIRDMFGEDVLSINGLRDNASFQEYERSRKGNVSQENNSANRGKRDGARSFGKNSGNGLEYSLPDRESAESLLDRLQSAETDKTTAENSGGVEYAVANKRNPYEAFKEPITLNDIEILRSIGKNSINDFTQKDIEKSQKWAYKFYQQLGEKSPFFRRWFGDWRAEDVSPANIVSFAYAETPKINYGKRYIKNSELNTDILVDNTVIEDSLSYASKNGDKKQIEKLLGKIDDILSNGILLDTQISVHSSGNKKGSTQFMHYLYTPISINGAPFIAKLSVEEYDLTGKNRAYNLQRIEISEVSRAQYSQLIEENRGKFAYTSDALSVAQLFNFVKQKDKNFNPKSVDKHLLNDDGTPKVFYHGTDAKFTEFDKRKSKSGFYGKGFYFTTEKSHANQYGNEMAVYLNIKKPLVHGNSKISESQIIRFLEVVAENDDYSIENYGTYDVNQIANNITSRDAFNVIQDINATAIGDFGEALQLFNEVNGTTFDGIITPTETVVYNANQIKSAENNIGTYDYNNNIEYSLSNRDSAEALLDRLQNGEITREQYLDAVSGKKELNPVEIAQLKSKRLILKV